MPDPHDGTPVVSRIDAGQKARIVVVKEFYGNILSGSGIRQSRISIVTLLASLVTLLIVLFPHRVHRIARIVVPFFSDELPIEEHFTQSSLNPQRWCAPANWTLTSVRPESEGRNDTLLIKGNEIGFLKPLDGPMTYSNLIFSFIVPITDANKQKRVDWIVRF